MSEYMREASAALRSWIDSFDAAGTGIPMVDLVLRDRYDEQEPLTVQLAELTSDDFRYLLEYDAAARAGTGPVEHHGHSVEPGDDLRYAAARLEMLTNSRSMSYKVDLRRPGNAASVLAETSRACDALAGMVEHATGGVLDDLRGGALVALSHADGPHIVPDQAETAEDYGTAAGAMVDLLREATAELAKLADAIGQLQHTSTAIGATPADGPTLATEVVLEHKTAGAVNTGRYHVRVYRPENAKPVVLIGDMDDNHSASITNCVEQVAATIAEELLGGAAWDSVTWVQFYAPGRFAAPTTGLIQLVDFTGPFAGPVWRGIGHDRLEELAGGPVKSWHAKDHNVTALAKHGAAVLRPKSRPHVPSTTGNTRPQVGAHLDDPDVDPPRPRRRWWQR
ncbi:hypothetical protein BS329_40160 [Amycolatopsis coloradensis]|uniref:Uncharacterized protein n=1 Tax=Amycolatopsis coloradensis TaxID=76021 RepID=A0A1R0KDT0_9PSEU|nr:hypothetical protein [Amycolatopsis coloradensis]OLZ43156.1 hypothetical protein BS329_40160 [Amycolatopsis coloradensis]